MKSSRMHEFEIVCIKRIDQLEEILNYVLYDRSGAVIARQYFSWYFIDGPHGGKDICE